MEDASDPNEPEPALGEHGQRLAVALRDAVLHLRAKELIEVAEESVELVVAQCTMAGLDARTPKHMTRSVVRTLMVSDQVDEVYGSDEVLSDELRRFLGG